MWWREESKREREREGGGKESTRKIFRLIFDCIQLNTHKLLKIKTETTKTIKKKLHEISGF